MDWWLQKRKGLNNLKKKGLDYTFRLVSWRVWKERNDRVFDRGPANSAARLLHAILEEGHLWISADAKHMAAL
jgi:hypothetical protein